VTDYRWNLQKTRAVLTTWPFVACLLALIVNDGWLKAAYPGLLTGKLSDFSGVGVVSLLILSIQPCRRPFAYGLIITTFSWWKSPFSQPAIDAVNAHLSVTIGRVVDYSDLAALLAIPACTVVISRLPLFTIPWLELRRALQIPIVALVAIGLMATTIIRVRQDYDVRQPVGAAKLDQAKIAEIFADVAKEFRLKCKDCTSSTSERHYVGRAIWLTYAFSEDSTLSFQVEAEPMGWVNVQTADERAEALRDKIKLRLESEYKGLDYVEKRNTRPEPVQ